MSQDHWKPLALSHEPDVGYDLYIFIRHGPWMVVYGRSVTPDFFGSSVHLFVCSSVLLPPEASGFPARFHAKSETSDRSLGRKGRGGAKEEDNGQWRIKMYKS
jgi:hypothetical protein